MRKTTLLITLLTSFSTQLFAVTNDAASVKMSDAIPPELSSNSPLYPETGEIYFDPTAQFVMNFNENVLLANGTIELYLADNSTLVESFDTGSSSAITVSGSTVTITPSSFLTDVTGYYILVDGNAISDMDGNLFAGIFIPSDWWFYTGDFTGPIVDTDNPGFPLDNDVNIPNGFFVSTINFNEPVELGVSGTINLYKENGILVESIDVSTTTAVTINASYVSITSSYDLLESTHYYYQIQTGAFVDYSGNPYAGINNNSTWSFTTGDYSSPVVLTDGFLPADNATNVAVNANLTVVFDENIEFSTGVVELYKMTSGSTLIETFSASSAGLSITDSILTINPTDNFLTSTDYYLLINYSTVNDVSENNNHFIGFMDYTRWNFTTSSFAGIKAVNSSPVIRLIDENLILNIEGNYMLSIVDIQGRSIMSSIGLNGETTTDLSKEKAGVYFVTVDTGNAVEKMKIVLND